MAATEEDIEIARRWCNAQAGNYSLVLPSLGSGGTAPVFEVSTPQGPLALKLYDEAFSTGEKGEIERQRIEQQVLIGDHDCEYLVRVYDGGSFENRLFLLMSRAPGQELEKRLHDIPRSAIRQIVSQVAEATIFLRSKSLCHRDIKSANVYITDDFQHATLLDVSVVRDIFDPLGIGTDHDGQLPVVATARYSPPEYLFRLLEPSPELWDALTVYQLGALLHDLIMRAPMFNDEFSASKTNRYRFAWTVATQTPVVKAEDVDKDLVFLAQMALEKDWQRRTQLKLEDFLATPSNLSSVALEMLGLSKPRGARNNTDQLSILNRIRKLSEQVEECILSLLREYSVTSTHNISPGNDDLSKTLVFTWKNINTLNNEALSHDIQLHVSLSLAYTHETQVVHVKVDVTAHMDGSLRAESSYLPEIIYNENVAQDIADAVMNSLAMLAPKLVRVS